MQPNILVNVSKFHDKSEFRLIKINIALSWTQNAAWVVKTGSAGYFIYGNNFAIFGFFYYSYSRIKKKNH